MGGGYSQLAPLKVNTKLPMTDPLVVIIVELVCGGGYVNVMWHHVEEGDIMAGGYSQLTY